MITIGKPEKRKYRKAIVFLIILVIVFLIWGYFNSPYTHVEERKIINYALQGSRGDFKLLETRQNVDLKEASYILLNKDSDCVESFFEIRLRMKEYLKKNPDYFLNNNYNIGLSWAGTRSGGPGMLSFLSLYGIDYGGTQPSKIIKQFDSLDCLIIHQSPSLFSLSNISDYTLFEDIKGLILRERADIEDIEILENFKSLEFFEPNDKITDQEIERVKEMHPNCEIYGR